MFEYDPNDRDALPLMLQQRFRSLQEEGRLDEDIL